MSDDKKKKDKKGIVKEFKEFISKGNVMDMAVGIIIGSAFTAIVTSLVNDIAMPFIAKITGGISFDQLNIVLGEGEEAPVVAIGSFILAVVNFLLIAIVVFALIKGINKLKGNKKEPEAAPTTKKCPFCQEEISIEATRCPHCTSELSETK